MCVQATISPTATLIAHGPLALMLAAAFVSGMNAYARTKRVLVDVYFMMMDSIS
jgi:hypothetical protein